MEKQKCNVEYLHIILQTQKTHYVNHRWTEKNKILHWDELSFDSAVKEYLKRMGLTSTAKISKELWNQWRGDISKKRNRRRLAAMDMAEDELQTQFELKRLQHRKRTMTGKIYDGRVYNTFTGKYDGYILQAGISIGYWITAGSYSINHLDDFIQTKIVRIGDEFEIRQTKTIEVVHSLTPAGPKLYPLHQCKLIPSEVKDESHTYSIGK